jgi:DNA mismatch repair protein MutS2
VDAVAARVSLGGDLEAKTGAARPRAPADPSQLKPLDPARIALGSAVHVPRLRSDATVIEGPSKGRARIAVGPLKLWVELSDLFAPSSTPAIAEKRPQPAPSAPRIEARNVDNTVDVRGMRVDDALGLVESFVDRMYGADARVGYVLHGHGSGALRDAIRKHLREHVPLVAETHGAEPADGGDAITVFRLT